MSNDDSIHKGSFREFEQAGWARIEIVEGYDSGFSKLTTQAIPPLLDAVGTGPGIQLLDIATGPGYAAAAASGRGARVTAIDFSPAMVAKATRLSPEVNFLVGDAQRLDFPDASFQAVVINFGLLHFEQPELALREAHRVLCSGGRIGLTVWASPERTVALGLLQEALKAHGDLTVSLPQGTPFFRFSDHSECRRVLEGAGFVECVVTEVSQIWDVASADELLDALEQGTVRNRAILSSQTSEALASIRVAYRESLKDYELPDGRLRVPMPAVLACGRKS